MGQNGVGQLGIGCDKLGMGPHPPTQVNLTQSSVRFWSTQQIANLQPPLGALTLAELSLDLTADANLALSTTTLAGRAAPCRAACEAVATCGGFTLDLAADPFVPLDGCAFYKEDGWRLAQYSVSVSGGAAAAYELHLREEATTGGVAAVAAGAGHVVAAGLAELPQCPTNATGAECFGNGECMFGTCRCSGEWLGDACAKQACEPQCVPAHGSCQGDPGARACVCIAGWEGPSCDLAVCPKYGGLECAGHGTCDAQTVAPHRCECEAGWTGDACELPACEQLPALGGSPACSGQGTCVCAEGASGAAASACAGAAFAPRCDCDDGWVGDTCSKSCPVFEGKQCAGRGSCLLDSGAATAVCSCPAGWTGAACERALCPMDTEGEECGGRMRGECDRTATGATCNCKEGWGGAACGAIQCPDACSGHGACELQADGRPACVCEPGWELDNCSDNAGARALQLAAAFGGGILGLLLCLGLMQYLIRMGNSGRLDGPADVAMRSRWRAKHHSTRVATLPVHTPKRAAGAQWPKGAAFA